MGSCCGCLNRDSVPDNHPTKFKVTNVDDEGVELGVGIMELTQNELVLHLQRREAVRWPYLCLRRYGYDSNLFSFESGRRCQTGQGIFAFKCSRAEEIFSLLQDLMQCNSINVTEEPVIVTRSSHPAELDLPRTPQQPNALGYTVSSFSNGFPSCPGEGPRLSAPRRPSSSSLRHPSLGEESTSALIAPDEQSHTYVNTPASEVDQRRTRHCLQPLPEARTPFPSQAREPGPRDPQVFLQPGQVKFVLGPTPARRHVLKCQSLQDAPPHNNNNEGPSECPEQPKCTYENVGGGLRRSPSWKLSPKEPGWGSLAYRRAALLHYENLPPLPPVWESHGQLRAGEPGDDGDLRDGLTPSSNGFPEGEEDETPLQKPTGSRASARSHGSFPVPLTRRRGSPRVFSFDFRRPGPEPPRQLNYIQVELKGWGGERPKGAQTPSTPRATGPSSDSYAVIDLKKTAAMSSLQRALPRDDGTARKTRHNSTDLPL
ncbi:fibroblast growth factor receptor substrate 3 [Cavia porcellus]|uniref:Fibroblast growth factor receptor substrate 3 n=1 Tax=Cavia porcellus TaxID=10141 RepID=H0VDX2_CAVPO|nr:fibroblast growth factor receptor substrate 3 [Cavia porcellus]XP_013012436.1 fibroblast growth factor receptor substrate 3 [Cavia porcellus]XP_013012437.1 fibroblast growth factor receptor substrate 3 [Cavia porcellus]